MRERDRTLRRRAVGAALSASAVLAACLAPGALSAAPAPTSTRARPGLQSPSKREVAPAKLVVPPEIARGVEETYSGDPDAAMVIATTYKKQHPDDPLGFLLEGEARWWRLYCSESEIRYRMVDLWQLPKRPDNPPYLAAAKESVKLASDELKRGESARAELMAGMGYALEARIYGLRGERKSTARAGVRAREHLLKAIHLDPALSDAYTGLGLYNYYVDTLSPIVKLLRIFLGIPGGSKSEGIRQLRRAMDRAPLTGIEARFYLAKNLRTYDRKYAEALAVAQPLVERYPNNPIFLLLDANLKLELGRKAEAATDLEKLDKLKIPDASCANRARRLGNELLGRPAH